MIHFFAELTLWLLLGTVALIAAAKKKSWLWEGLPIQTAMILIALWPAGVILLLAARVQQWRQK
jgi:hypothetical protein